MDTLVRPGIVTLLAILQWFAASVWLMFIVGVWLAGGRGGGFSPITAVVASLLLGALLGQLACGVGLWQLKPYGRTLQFLWACLGLFTLPFGTIASILILVYLNKPGVKVLFSGLRPSQMSGEQVAALATVSRSSRPMLIALAVLLVVTVVSTVAIVAAIAVPGLLRARMASNEVSALATVRALSVAETAAFVEDGAFATMACLKNGTDCPQPHPGGSRLYSGLANDTTRGGYRFEFYPGAVTPGGGGLLSFAYVAEPVSGAAGMRSFCTDSSGRICHSYSPSIGLASGLCPAVCVEVVP